VGPGSRVVEIGAGLGSLTTALARAGAAEVLAIEFDRALLPALEEAVVSTPVVRVLAADATRVDWTATLGTGPWICCANLPYNVGTRIVLEVLASSDAHPVVVLLQREVGERLAAGPGDEAYGPTSLRVAQRATARLIRDVPPEVFWPRPSVGSVVVRRDRRSAPLASVDEVALWRVVDGAFAQRRKTVRNAVRRLGFGASDTSAILARAGVDGQARPEQLPLTAFAAIAKALPA
jgi:16S rRNA (adenine1518-N6/adenine1519-N6)-dimethyltransferase